MGPPRYVGLPRSHESSRRTINCSTINCRARSTLRALLRMAVPPVLSSTSAEYSLQEVKGRTRIDASVRCHRVSVREWESGKGVSAARVLQEV
jgi:hypothetical protein